MVFLMFFKFIILFFVDDFFNDFVLPFSVDILCYRCYSSSSSNCSSSSSNCSSNSSTYHLRGNPPFPFISSIYTFICTHTHIHALEIFQIMNMF